MERETAQSIVLEIKANRAKLDACKRHKFIVTEVLQRDVVCLNCSGKMRKLDALHYRDGYMAHGGNAKDVFEYYI